MNDLWWLLVIGIVAFVALMLSVYIAVAFRRARAVLDHVPDILTDLSMTSARVDLLNAEMDQVRTADPDAFAHPAQPKQRPGKTDEVMVNDLPDLSKEEVEAIAMFLRGDDYV